eukprot:jgi/Psemu1/310931/fgenesh1_kg.697_\
MQWEREHPAFLAAKHRRPYRHRGRLNGFGKDSLDETNGFRHPNEALIEIETSLHRF